MSGEGSIGSGVVGEGCPAGFLLCAAQSCGHFGDGEEDCRGEETMRCTPPHYRSAWLCVCYGPMTGAVRDPAGVQMQNCNLAHGICVSCHGLGVGACEASSHSRTVSTACRSHSEVEPCLAEYAHLRFERMRPLVCLCWCLLGDGRPTTALSGSCRQNQRTGYLVRQSLPVSQSLGQHPEDQLLAKSLS